MLILFPAHQKNTSILHSTNTFGAAVLQEALSGVNTLSSSWGLNSSGRGNQSQMSKKVISDSSMKKMRNQARCGEMTVRREKGGGEGMSGPVPGQVAKKSCLKKGNLG